MVPRANIQSTNVQPTDVANNKEFDAAGILCDPALMKQEFHAFKSRKGGFPPWRH